MLRDLELDPTLRQEVYGGIGSYSCNFIQSLKYDLK